MTKYQQHRTNYGHKQNTWNRNMWPQQNYLHNRHHARPIGAFDNDLNYWCETCDKGFRTPDHLEFHIKLHQVKKKKCILIILSLYYKDASSNFLLL